MVHAFQYDIFARGKAGGGIAARSRSSIRRSGSWRAWPSICRSGRTTALDHAWMRDAALNGNLPTIEQMTEHPDQYFPYRYGQSLWAYVGQKWGDEAIGADHEPTSPTSASSARSSASPGCRSRTSATSGARLCSSKYLPQVAQLDRPRKFAQPLLTQKRSGGEIFLAPALSPDGKYIAFLSNGSFLRGQVFIDLWLGDAETGKRITRLVKSTFDPNFEELGCCTRRARSRPTASCSRSPRSGGQDVLYLLDVKRTKANRASSICRSTAS